MLVLKIYRDRIGSHGIAREKRLKANQHSKNAQIFDFWQDRNLALLAAPVIAFPRILSVWLTDSLYSRWNSAGFPSPIKNSGYCLSSHFKRVDVHLRCYLLLHSDTSLHSEQKNRWWFSVDLAVVLKDTFQLKVSKSAMIRQKISLVL